jgi:hypothetical protein
MTSKELPVRIMRNGRKIHQFGEKRISQKELMINHLETPTPIELRSMLQEMVRKDLLGPAGGLDEVIDEPSVRSRYVIGMLAPKGQSSSPGEQDELAVDGANVGDDGKPASPIPQAANMLPSSFGITFCVPLLTPTIQITVRWGRYCRVRSEAITTESGEPKLVWQRTQVEAASEPIVLQEGNLPAWSPDPENPEVYVRGLVRRHDDSLTVTLYLINSQIEPKTSKDEAWVFQPELIVRSPDGAPIFIKRPLPPALSAQDPEDRRMTMLYRRKLEFAVGHGVATKAVTQPGNWSQAIQVQTDVMPSFEVERMESPTVGENPVLDLLETDMASLSQIQVGGFAAALDPLVNAYELWISTQEQSLGLEASEPDLSPFSNDAVLALQDCRDTLIRIRQGIELLDHDPQAAAAFQFANQAMSMQRVHSIFSQKIRQGQETTLEEVDIPRNRSWRPFQLAFILLNLPGLVDPTHPDRSNPLGPKADLLWFPTGGGKTEAYLGVAAFAMAIRRLKPDLGGISGRAGITVLMRYTLRLLTLQQFQRASTLICATELIRRGDPAKWGEEPFRIGLWVGEKSTPNWTKDAAEIINQDHNVHQAGGFLGGKGTPAQLSNCPWCGQPILPGRDITVERFEQGRGRTFQYCSDPTGECPFCRRQSPDEGLPIVVVDEEVYRRLPTLLIATVDKFAQMPWKGPVQMLFGRVNGYCPRHGFRSPEIEDSDLHPAKGRFPRVQTQPTEFLRPPDLIIQDELHLISGPLGTLVGLYETAVDELCTWTLNGIKIKPKVIASTATIRRARDQVTNLFMRDVNIFPPAGLNSEDNFFSKRVPSGKQTPGRLYVGVCAPGTRMKSILIRVYAAYMSAAQKLYNDYGRCADPWMTLIGYFNSIRELGGMRRVVDDALRTRLMNMDDRGLAKRNISPLSVDELTSRKSGTDIPKILDRLETEFDPALELQRSEQRHRGERPDASKYPLDVVLATNMISVGVDVSRLGLMVVAGQPKATAEYIQATSRVGRAFPGIVIAVYNWARPRDLSHYERFGHYHSTFYQQVEALSVTPFSPRALDRGLSAVLVSLLRLDRTDLNNNNYAARLTRAYPGLNAIIDEVSKRGESIKGPAFGNLIREMLRKRLDWWMDRISILSAPAELGYAPKSGGLTIPLLHQPADEDWEMFTCLNSLRDVEPGVALILNDYGMDRLPKSLSGESEAAV